MSYEAMAEELIGTLRGVKPPLEPLTHLTRGEDGIVLYLAARPEGALSGEISRALRLSTGRTATGLKDLESKGLVRRMTDGRDGRRVRVELTDRGRELAEEGRRRVKAFTTALLERLGEHDAPEFVRIMSRICDIEHREGLASPQF